MSHSSASYIGRWEVKNISDKVVGKVYEGAKGDGKFGPYQYYNFYLVGGKLKFSYCHTGKKAIPTEGMKIAYMEWEETQSEKDGKTFLNQTVKLLKPLEDGKVLSADTLNPKGKAPCGNGKDNPIWFCLSYAKDLRIAQITASPIMAELPLEVHVKAVASAGQQLLDMVSKPEADYPKPGEPTIEPDDPGPTDEEIPF
jgi:hypothetical protein